MIIIKTPEEFAQTTTRLCNETFGATKYYLDLEIEILDIYPLIVLVEAL